MNAPRGTDAAWELARRMARRSYVQAMRREAGGALVANTYPARFYLGPKAPTTPYYVHLADEAGLYWYAAFDIDAKTPEAFEQAREDLAVLVRLLTELDIPHVVCRSSTHGGFHVWVHVDGAELAVMDALATAAAAVLVQLDHGMLHNPATGGVRPPGSPHRNGGRSTVLAGDTSVLLTNPTPVAKLDDLTSAFQALRPALNPRHSAPSGAVDERWKAGRDLPRWGLAHMATIGGGQNPSWTGWMCLRAAAVAGWSLDDVRAAARTAPGMETYRTRPHGAERRRLSDDAAARRLERQWEKARASVATYEAIPRTETAATDLTELSLIVRTVQAMTDRLAASPGRWAASEHGLTDARVLAALGWLTLHTGKRTVHAAKRAVAELTGLADTTVFDSLTRLHKAELIQRVSYGDQANAAEYRLGRVFSTPWPQVRPQPNRNTRPPGQIFDQRAVLVRELTDRIEAGRHDAFTRDGLGPRARRAFESLTNEGQDIHQLSARSGVPTGRLSASLQRLKRHGLAVQRMGSWRRPLKDRRHTAARRLGVAGVLEARTLRRQRERELWKWFLADLAHRQSRGVKPRRPPEATQRVIFRPSDERGGEEAWPRYPRDAADRGDHRRAWGIVCSPEGVETLRRFELAA